MSSQLYTAPGVWIQIKAARGALAGGAHGPQAVGGWVMPGWGTSLHWRKPEARASNPPGELPTCMPQPSDVNRTPGEVVREEVGLCLPCLARREDAKWGEIPSGLLDLGVIEKITWEKSHVCSLNGESYRQVREDFRSEQTSLMPWNVKKKHLRNTTRINVRQEQSFPSVKDTLRRHTSLPAVLSENAVAMKQRKEKISNSLTRFHIANMVIPKFCPLSTSYLQFSKMDNIFCKPTLLKVFKNHLGVKFWVENENLHQLCPYSIVLNASPSKYFPSCLYCALPSVRNQKKGLKKILSVTPNWRPQEGRKRGEPRMGSWISGAPGHPALWGHVPLVLPTSSGWL